MKAQLCSAPEQCQGREIKCSKQGKGDNASPPQALVSLEPSDPEVFGRNPIWAAPSISQHRLPSSWVQLQHHCNQKISVTVLKIMVTLKVLNQQSNKLSILQFTQRKTLPQHNTKAKSLLPQVRESKGLAM